MDNVTYLQAIGCDMHELERSSLILDEFHEKRVRQLQRLQGIKEAKPSSKSPIVSLSQEIDRFSGARRSSELPPRHLRTSARKSVELPPRPSLDASPRWSPQLRGSVDMAEEFLLTIPQRSEKLSAARRVLEKLDVERQIRESKFDLVGCEVSTC